MKRTPLPLLAAALLVGCGSPAEPSPVSAAPRAADALMRKPMTTEQKIAAIERSSAPEDRKRAAIERLRSGKL